MLIRKRRHLEERHPEATPSGETPVCNRDAPPHCSSNGHTVLNAEGSTCDCTQPIDIKRQTRRYTTWSGTHTYTPPCSMMSGRRMPLYVQRQLCRYTCSGIRAAICMKRQLYRYRHAAAIAATHKRSHSCRHSVFHQERLLGSSALATNCSGD